jgi:hypothetical protein
VRHLLHSIRADDYNDLPAFLLMPFGLLFGTGRLAYILSIVNILAFPSAIALVLLHNKLSELQGHASSILPFISAGIVMLSPTFWHPILFGYADAGGIVAIGLILWLCASNDSFPEQRPRDLLVIGVLIPMLVLYRRWYAYWAVSFYIALWIQACVVPFSASKFDAKRFVRIASGCILQAIVSAAFFFAVAPTFGNRILHTDYADIYSAYRGSSTPFQAFRRIIEMVGLVWFSLAALGAVDALLHRRTRRVAAFLLVQWLAIFVLFARTQDFGPHQLYLLLPTLLVFATLLITRLVMKETSRRVAVLCGCLLVLATQFLATFSPRDLWYGKELRGMLLLGVRHPPLARQDINEVDRMLEVMRGLLAEADDRVYVLASSAIINSDVLQSAYLSLGRYEDVPRRILGTHDVDKRDGFPEGLLTAQYVIVADPIQYHLRPEDQRVVGIPAQQVLDQEGIGAAFMKLPCEFTLDEAVKIYVYQKIRPISEPEVASLSAALRTFYPDRQQVYEPRSIHSAIH